MGAGGHSTSPLAAPFLGATRSSSPLVGPANERVFLGALIQGAEGAAGAETRPPGDALRVEESGAAVQLALAVIIPAVLTGLVQLPRGVTEVPVGFVVERVPVPPHRAVVAVAVEVPRGVLVVAAPIPVGPVGVPARPRMVLVVFMTGWASRRVLPPARGWPPLMLFVGCRPTTVSLSASPAGVLMAPAHGLRLLAYRLDLGPCLQRVLTVRGAGNAALPRWLSGRGPGGNGVSGSASVEQTYP